MTNIQFCGAAQTVTGSCHLFETAHARLLVDCGMFQGPKTLKALNYAPFPFRPADIDAVLLTHAHIDHSGLLPKLVREGFRGRIFATRGTIDLCSYLLPDAGNIQESEVQTLNRRNAARGKPEITPIYTAADAIETLNYFQPTDYQTWVPVAAGIRARFWNAGHILGSASIELEIETEDRSNRPLRVLCSGDIGPDAKVLQSDPEGPVDIDYLLVESTYGDTDRAPATRESRRQLLAVEVREAANRKGPLIIPAFAVERTQELLVDLIDLMDRGEAPGGPIFLDSPLAIRATEVFRRHKESLDGEVDLDRILSSPHLRSTESVDESKAIARITGFHIIIAGSGMCEAGRIRHHLKHWLWHRDATVLLVGYQAQGTLGRFLREGVKAVRIQGEEIKVAARIRQLDEYSGHADGPELARWIAARRPVRRGVFLVHGELQSLAGLTERIAGRAIPEAKIFQPLLDEIFDLTSSAPTPVDGRQRRRLPSKQVVSLDWHNEMSQLLLDMNDQLEKAADDRARNVIVRKLKRALEEN